MLQDAISCISHNEATGKFYLIVRLSSPLQQTFNIDHKEQCNKKRVSIKICRSLDDQAPDTYFLASVRLSAAYELCKPRPPLVVCRDASLEHPSYSLCVPSGSVDCERACNCSIANVPLNFSHPSYYGWWCYWMTRAELGSCGIRDFDKTKMMTLLQIAFEVVSYGKMCMWEIATKVVVDVSHL
jgi:hypothetical protein